MACNGSSAKNVAVDASNSNCSGRTRDELPGAATCDVGGLAGLPLDDTTIWKFDGTFANYGQADAPLTFTTTLSRSGTGPCMLTSTEPAMVTPPVYSPDFQMDASATMYTYIDDMIGGYRSPRTPVKNGFYETSWSFCVRNGQLSMGWRQCTFGSETNCRDMSGTLSR